jgi:hypothetical protein
MLSCEMFIVSLTFGDRQLKRYRYRAAITSA